MQIVNPLSSFTWSKPLDVHGVKMSGVPEKQGWAFSAHGWRAARDVSSHNADDLGRAIRAMRRPLSLPVLAQARADYRMRKAPPFPKYFIIEPTNICNRACGFCPITVMERPGGFKGHMAWGDFVKLMEECGQHDVYGLSLYQLGESMLWRGRIPTISGETPVDIRTLIDVAKSVGKFKAVNVSTNGDVDNLAALLDCPVDDVIISIDGTTQVVYAENRPSTRGAKDDLIAFTRTHQRVSEFLAKKGASTTPWVRMQIINKGNTKGQVLDFIRYWIEQPGVDDVFVKNLDSMRPWLGSKVVSDDEDALKAEQVENMPCQHLWAIGSMTADGTLNACCHDAKTQLTDGANIKTSTFESFWNGAFMKTLRNEHVQGTFRMPCLTCRERDPWL